MVVNGDPNSVPGSISTVPRWPKWTAGGEVLTFVDVESHGIGGITADPASVVTTPVTPLGVILTLDNYRTAASESTFPGCEAMMMNN